MSEQVLGLTINQIMAYTAIANVVLVVVLAAVNIYYAGHVSVGRRQEQVAAQPAIESPPRHFLSCASRWINKSAPIWLP
jgi:hypothetical protein